LAKKPLANAFSSEAERFHERPTSWFLRMTALGQYEYLAGVLNYLLLELR